MIRSPVLSAVLVLSLVCSLILPSPAQGFLDFSEDTLKATGIIIGITAGVVLLIVLVAGTIKDIKGTDEEEEDIWAELRKNRALCHVPSLFAGPDILDGMRATLHPLDEEPPVLPPWALPSSGSVDEAAASRTALRRTQEPVRNHRAPDRHGRTLADARWISLNPSDLRLDERLCDETSR